MTVALVDAAGVRTWSLSVVGTDDLTSASTVTVNQVTHTATFTAPSSPAALILRSQVNGGVGPDGQSDPSLTTTLGVYVLTSAGLRLISSNETVEGSAAHGWIAQLNAPIRGGRALTVWSVDVTALTDYNLTQPQADADAIYAYGAPAGTVGLHLDGLTFLDGKSWVIRNASSHHLAVWLGGNTVDLDPFGTATATYFAGDGAIETSGIYGLAGPTQTGVVQPDSQLVHVLRGDGTWGNVVDGFLTVATGNADAVLSSGQYGNAVLRFTGVLTANRTMTMPLAAGRAWHVINDCTGAWGLIFKAATGTGPTVANGSRATIGCDGTSFYG